MSVYNFDENLYSILKFLVTKPELIEYDTTTICFEIFLQIVPLSSNKCFATTQGICFNSLTKLKNLIRKLILQDRFSRDLFNELLFETVEEIPLQIVGYLAHLDIISYEYYIEQFDEDVVIREWNNLYNANLQHTDAKFMNSKWIACDILILLIRYSYEYGRNFYSLPNTEQKKKFSFILEEIINTILIEFFTNPTQYIIYDILQRINRRNALSGPVLREFSQDILMKILTREPLADIYDVYMMQVLLTSKHVPKIVIDIFCELFRYANLEELYKMIDTYSTYAVNWKYVLIAVSACIHKSSNGPNQMEKFVHSSLQKAFEKAGNFEKLIGAILFARHACFEIPEKFISYSEWYSKTFGITSDCKTVNSPWFFNFLLTSITKVINYEPKSSLDCHIHRCLQIPPNCQHEMKRFKDLCKIQMVHIQESPTISIDEEMFPIRIILDNSLMKQKLTWPVRYIISEYEPNVFRNLVHLIVNDPKYSIVKERVLADASVLSKIPQCQLEPQDLPASEEY